MCELEHDGSVPFALDSGNMCEQPNAVFGDLRTRIVRSAFSIALRPLEARICGDHIVAEAKGIHVVSALFNSIDNAR